MKSVMKWMNLTLGASDLKPNDILNQILMKWASLSWLVSRRITCLRRPLMNKTSLSLGAPEFKTIDILKEMLNEMAQSEPGSL